MNDVATLLTALGGFITALTSAVALLVTVRRVSPRERQDAAERAVQRVAEHATQQILSAAEDGEVTPDELDGIRRALDEDRDRGRA